MRDYHVRQQTRDYFGIYMLAFLQLGVTLASFLYLWQRYSYLRKLNRASWQSLVLELEHWSPDAATPWIRFQRARALLELVDYAALSGSQSTDFPMMTHLATIRREAAEDRLAAMMAILKSVLPNAGQIRSA